MKIIEETLEILGFDPDKLYVVVGNEACYYEKLPSKWKENSLVFVFLMDYIIYGAMLYFALGLGSILLKHAVNSDDLKKVQYLLLDNNAPIDAIDHTSRTILCHAAEKGNEQIIRLLLKSGARVAQQNILSPVYAAADKGNAKVVELLLENVEQKDMAELIDRRLIVESTALHAAAKRGHLEIVKILLRYGATYAISDGTGLTPLKVSTSEEVSFFLKLVDECFENAKEADDDLIHKLKELNTEDFMAVASARNNDGQTLAATAAKANAKNIAVIILRMISEMRANEK